MNTRSYALVTVGYGAFTVTDGALRMLVLLYFHDLGYSALAIAFLFLLYEAMGVATNLVGGWVGTRTGLNKTLIAGLALQVVALVTLSFHDPGWAEWFSICFVMTAQALSGVAKDLTKLSSKSAVKFVAGESAGSLLRLVAVLTGSKNALKGFGFFAGSLLLMSLGFVGALRSMALVLAVVGLVIAVWLGPDIGKAPKSVPLRSILSKTAVINWLSAARLFLFAARDIWFVVALPIYFDESLDWSHAQIGAFMATWVIGYGVVQVLAPAAVGGPSETDAAPDRRAAVAYISVLTGVSFALAIAVTLTKAAPVVVIGGLIVFGIVFAVNSSLHSYLIVKYAEGDNVSLDVGFYYSANAVGRLAGTLLSGLFYLWGGLEAALWGSAIFVAIAASLTRRLPDDEAPSLAAMLKRE